jgi:hypothetical protein
LADYLRLVPAQQPRGTQVPGGDAPLQVNAEDRIVRGAVQNKAQPLLALTQGGATHSQFGIGMAERTDFCCLFGAVSAARRHRLPVPHLRLGCAGRARSPLLLKLV